MKQRKCRKCHRPTGSRKPVCKGCERIQGAFDAEVRRQETRLLLRGIVR
jgi:hypothetical protein